MPSYKRTAHLLPTGLAGLGATLAMAVAMVGTATAVSAAGAQGFRSAESRLDLSARAPSAPKLTSALQPGQTVSSVMTGNGSASVGGPTPWTPASAPTSALQPGQTIALLNGPSAPKLTSALQPGQTVSSVMTGNGSASVGGPTASTPASGPTSAPQPGQTGW